MESSKCKICFRQFSNRKALGGHMRAHLAKLPIPPKTSQLRNPIEPSSSKEEEPKLHHVGDDCGMDSRRSKHSSRSINKETNDQSPISSTAIDTGVVSVEDAAYLIMQISRDKWTKEREDLLYQIRPVYSCETSDKVFKSYQALRGHKTGHKKMKMEDNEEDPAPTHGNERIFGCPHCSRVFQSGQALGGHKKVHVSISNAAIFRPNLIDLNHFPSEDDDHTSPDEATTK